MSEDDAQDDRTRSRTLRTFGRALHIFGSSAKAVLTQPMKAARRGGGKQKPMAETPQAVPAVERTSSGTAHQSSTALHSLQMVRNDLMDSFQHTQQLLSGHLQESAEFLRQKLVAGPGTDGFLSASCFPVKIAKRNKTGGASLGTTEDSQDLVCSGTRNLLRIKLYDFAVYLDRKEVQHAQARKHFEGRSSADSRETVQKLAAQIRDSKDVEMSLLVRASRNLPIILLSKEYERILRRRLRVVGGNPQDPALNAMMDTFREDSLPADIRQGGSVKKGTVLAFRRDHEGNIIAKANHHELISVKSQKLAQAVFDIYLGDQVVCTRARDDAVSSFKTMLESGAYQPPPSDLLCSQAVCKIGRL